MKTYHIRSTYSPGSGSFGIFSDSKIVIWYGCREQLQEQLDIFPSRKLLFHCHSNQHKNVISFINKVEKTIRLPVKDRVKFHLTNKPDVLYLLLGRFWSSTIRRSLLTILLRAGRTYDSKKNNWEEVIDNDEYLNATRHAFDKFMSGFTDIQWQPKYDCEYVNESFKFVGWVDSFTDDYNLINKTFIKRKRRGAKFQSKTKKNT
jgi:hypothetical protein